MLERGNWVLVARCWVTGTKNPEPRTQNPAIVFTNIIASQTMATPVLMPKQGQSVESCIITKWFRKKGESVSQGDILFSYETDKAAFDLESPAGGILLEIFFDEGAEVPVLVNVAVIGKPGEAPDSFNPGQGAENIASTASKAFTASKASKASTASTASTAFPLLFFSQSLPTYQNILYL